MITPFFKPNIGCVETHLDDYANGIEKMFKLDEELVIYEEKRPYRIDSILFEF
jgi:hypothetical protein